MRILQRTSLRCFGFLMVVIFCILLRVEGKGKGKGKGFGGIEGKKIGGIEGKEFECACSEPYCSNYRPPIASSSNVSPQQVCTSETRQDDYHAQIVTKGNDVLKGININDLHLEAQDFELAYGPKDGYKKLQSTIDALIKLMKRFTTEENIPPKEVFEELVVILEIYKNKFKTYHAYVAFEINTARRHLQEFINEKQMWNNDRLKTLYEKLLRESQTMNNHLKESKGQLEDCLTKQAVLLREKEKHQREVASLEKQKNEIQKASRTKDNKINSLYNDHKKNVESLQQQHINDINSLEKQHQEAIKKFEDIQLKVDLRQLFNDFRQENKVGEFIDKIQLLNWARTCQANEIETRTEKYGNAPNRKKPNEFPLADIHRLRTHSTFSGVVISLYKEKTRLEKAKNDPNISPKIKSETQLKITAILRQLEALKKVAGSYKPSMDEAGDASRMKWSQSIGRGYVQWCILVAEANEACHPNMNDEEILTYIRTRAEEDSIVHNERKLGEVIIAVIDEIRASLESPPE